VTTPPRSHVLSAEQQVVLVASAPLTKRWGAYLAGGMGLALQLGHRRSADFDWFTPKTLPPSELLADLRSTALTVQVRQNDEGTFLGQVGTVDYSVFRYTYPLVDAPAVIDGCAVASLRDIAAMKMTAIVQRATKRDYVDLHAIFTSKRLGVRDVISTMQAKFPRADPSLAIRGLTYFRDVERDPMPQMIASTSWEGVKGDLTRIVRRELGREGPSR
jgi:hypothetical protein